MDKINMSDFLQTKKIIFEDGDAKIIKPQINGEISINEFNETMIQDIQNNVINKLTDKEIKNDSYFTYKIFPYIANVNMNINYKQFETLINNPKRPFSLLLEMVVNEIDEMFETAKDLTRINGKAETFKEKNKDLFQIEELSKEKREEELIKELTNNYNNKEIRNQILNEINKLREE